MVILGIFLLIPLCPCVTFVDYVLLLFSKWWQKNYSLYRMIVLVHMLVCAFEDLSSPSWVNDVKLVTAQAVEAILDASERSINLSPP